MVRVRGPVLNDGVLVGPAYIPHRDHVVLVEQASEPVVTVDKLYRRKEAPPGVAVSAMVRGFDSGCTRIGEQTRYA